MKAEVMVVASEKEESLQGLQQMNRCEEEI
jgi:hypothetical protein